MSGKGYQRDPVDPIEETAREWAVLLNSGHANDQQKLVLQRWVDENPLHKAAYQRFELLLGDLSTVDSLDRLQSPRSRTLKRVSSFAAPMAIAAAIAIVAVLFQGFGVSGSFDSEERAVETQIAEIRDLVLPDGSVVTLGARSRIETDFSKDIRLVRLLDGEAFFDVESDPDRPFYVAVDDRVIRVVGTQFAVRRSESIFRVTVAEGIVEVIEAATPLAAERKRETIEQDVLFAGDQIVVAKETDHKTLSDVEPDEAGAWRRGWLSYHDASLAEIVADANRYDARTITLASVELAEIRVTAAFGADDIDQFVSALTASHEISADYSQPNVILLRRSSDGYERGSD